MGPPAREWASIPPMADAATLLITCPDRKGIVASLAQLLYGHGANILDSDQHTDAEVGMFFQRLRVDLSDLRTDEITIRSALEELADRFQMQWSLRRSHDQHRLGIFVSKYPHCLYDLLMRHQLGELSCDVSLVVSNHRDLEKMAHDFGVPFHYVPVTKETKAEAEAAQLELLAKHECSLVVMARYMQILTEDFLAKGERPVINIHHSFLPAFIGSRPYHQAKTRGVKLIGATAHYATGDLDEGPIISQDVVPCSHRDTVDDLIRKGRDIERVVLARAVRAHLDDRILTYANKTVVF